MEKAVCNREKLHIECLLLTAYCLLMCQSRSETSRTHLHLFGLSFNVNSHGLEVRIPAPFRFIVGMTYIIACNRSLTTYFTYLRHSCISYSLFTSL